MCIPRLHAAYIVCICAKRDAFDVIAMVAVKGQQHHNERDEM